MDMTKFAGAGFVTFETVCDQPLRETIAEVSIGQYGKPVLTFESGKMISVNATNAKALIKAFGGDSDGWIRQQVDLSPGQINFQGQPTDVVRITPLDGGGSPPATRGGSSRRSVAGAALPFGKSK